MIANDRELQSTLDRINGSSNKSRTSAGPKRI